MRSIVYTNPNGVSITLGQGSVYGITSIEGLGVPDEMLQSQRAPYQHGSTYIDQLLNDREITVSGIISVGGKPSVSYPLRHDLVAVINPLLGQGVITYTNDHVVRKATCTAIGPVFANNNSNEGSQRYMITFHCHDPFLYFDTASTINLPTPVNSAETVINSAQTGNNSVIIKSDGSIFVVYYRLSDSSLVSRTFTTVWSGENVIAGPVGGSASVTQKKNGDLVVVYSRTSDYYLVSRTFTTVWGAEVIIASYDSATPCIKTKANGDLIVVYKNNLTGLIEMMTYTTVWSSPSVISTVNSNYPYIIQKTNGDLFIVYNHTSNGYLFGRTYTTSWSDEIIINTENTFYPTIIQKSNGNLLVVYSRFSDKSLFSRDYVTSWSSQSLLIPASGDYPSVIQNTNGSLSFFYSNSSGGQLAIMTRSITPVNASNTGQYKTPVITRLNGPSINPRFINSVTLLFMRLNITLLAGEYFIIDTTFGKKSVTLMKNGILQNGIQYMDSGSTFFDLAIGNNTIYYEDDSYASTATATMTWTNRDIGV